MLLEELLDLVFEEDGVVPLGSSLWALQVEPKDGVKEASVDHHSIFQGLLEHAVNVVFLEGIALRVQLSGRYRKGVHYSIRRN